MDIKKIKDRARDLARYKIPIPKKCSIKGCGTIGERHHPDYSKPLDIVWLCKKHHGFVHRKPTRYCDVEGCNKVHLARGKCRNHYFHLFELRDPKKVRKYTLNFVKKHGYWPGWKPKYMS